MRWYTGEVSTFFNPHASPTDRKISVLSPSDQERAPLVGRIHLVRLRVSNVLALPDEDPVENVENSDLLTLIMRVHRAGQPGDLLPPQQVLNVTPWEDSIRHSFAPSFWGYWMVPYAPGDGDIPAANVRPDYSGPVAPWTYSGTPSDPLAVEFIFRGSETPGNHAVTITVEYEILFEAMS